MKKQLVLLVFVLFLTASAIAEIDGFEDGDYNNDPSWNEYSSADVGVTTNNVYDGQYALDNGPYSTPSSTFIDSSSLDFSSGDINYTVWAYHNSQDTDVIGMGDTTDVFQSSGNNYLDININGGTLEFDTYDGSTFVGEDWGSVNTGQYYKYVIDFRPSQNSFEIYAYDTNENLVAQTGDVTRSNFQFQYVMMGTGSTFDEVQYNSIQAGTSPDIQLHGVDAGINETDLDSNVPTPWEERPMASISGFEAGDNAWVEVYTSGGTLDYNRSLDTGYSHTDGTLYNYTIIDGVPVEEFEVNRDYEFYVYDSSEGTTNTTQISEFVDNNVIPDFNYEDDFNNTELNAENPFNINIQWHNWNYHLNAKNLTYDMDYKLENETTWEDGTETYYTNYDNGQYITAGSIDVQVNYSQGLEDAMTENRNVTLRHTQIYSNASTGNHVKEYTEYTYHTTSNVDNAILNAMAAALEPLINLIDTVIDIIQGIVQAIFDILVEIFNSIIDIAVAIVITIIDIITYIIGMSMSMINYFVTYLLNFNLEISIINLATNETLNVNDSEASLIDGISDGYAVQANRTMADHVNETDTGLASIFQNLEGTPLFEYELRSNLFGRTDETGYTTDGFEDGNCDSNINWNGCNSEGFMVVDDDPIYGGYSLRVSSISNGIHANNVLFNNSDRYSYYLEVKNISSTGYVRHRTSITDTSTSPTLNGPGYEIYADTGTGIEISSQYERNDLNTVNSGKYDTYKMSVIHEDQNYRYEVYNVNDDNFIMNETLSYSDAEDVDPFDDRPVINGSKEYQLDIQSRVGSGTDDNNSYTYTDNVTFRNANLSNDTRTLTVNAYSNPYDYPNGYPIGTVALIGLASLMISFITNLAPDSLVNALGVFFGSIGAVLNGITSGITLLIDAFVFVFVDGLRYLIMGAKLLLLVKGLQYLEVAHEAYTEDHGRSMTGAAHYILEDVKDQVLMLERLSREVMTFSMDVSRTIINLLRAIRDFIKIW